MAEADPRPVSVVAVDGAAVDNVRSNADQIQVPFHFYFWYVMHVTSQMTEIFKGKDLKILISFYLKKSGFLHIFSSMIRFLDTFNCLEKEIEHVILDQNSTSHIIWHLRDRGSEQYICDHASAKWVF